MGCFVVGHYLFDKGCIRYDRFLGKRFKRMSDATGDFVLEWLQRARSDQLKKKDQVPFDATGQLKTATWTLLVFQIVLIIMFGVLGGTSIIDPKKGPGTGTQAYNMYIGVEIMMFIGFGYLMTFLKLYGLGALGFTMLLTAIALQWALFTESFWKQLFFNTLYGHWYYVEMDMYSLLNCLYAVSAVLISFGAVIGKASPSQLVIMAIVELACHSFNFEVLLNGTMLIVDVGGTYADHMFGAYFGLAVAYMLGKPNNMPEMGYSGDIFAMIGTLFLWVYWPSFVIGASPADSVQQQYGMVNTILALSSSTVCAFWLSSILDENGRFRPVDIQNATLAGGVAIGCSANLTLSGFGAIMIGCASGLVSCFGFNKIMPFLEDTIGLHDTCGVHNLHGMPSVIGGIASAIIAVYKGFGRARDSAIYGASVNDQWWRQLVAILLVVIFAIVSGLITGWIMKTVYPDETKETKAFHDNAYWTVADDYGRSLYTELTGILGDEDEAVKNAMEAAMPEFSSHSGRRRVTEKPMMMGVLPAAIEASQHGHKPSRVVSDEEKANARSNLEDEEEE